MKEPHFDADGCDSVTFAPFRLENALDTEWNDVRLAFYSWDWFRETYGSDTIDDYYMNGDAVEGLIRALRYSEGLEVEPDSIHYNSEGDTCYIHFLDLHDAIVTANLACGMIHDLEQIMKAIAVVREQGIEY